MLRMFSVTLMIALCLFSFVGSSYAFEIKSMTPSDGDTVFVTSYGGHTGHFAYLETDEAYFLVDWYVDGSLRHTNLGNGTTTQASFTPDPIYGAYGGVDYTIKAVAEPWEGEGSKSASYTLTVYKSVVKDAGSTVNGAKGYAAICECGWNGKTSYSDQFASLKNNSGASIDVTFKFVHRVVLANAGGGWKRDLHISPLDHRPVTVPNGESRSSYYSYTWTLHKGKNWWDPGDQAKLEAMATTDAGEPRKWEILATCIYNLPDPE